MPRGPYSHWLEHTIVRKKVGVGGLKYEFHSPPLCYEAFGSYEKSLRAEEKVITEQCLRGKYFFFILENFKRMKKKRYGEGLSRNLDKKYFHLMGNNKVACLNFKIMVRNGNLTLLLKILIY